MLTAEELVSICRELLPHVGTARISFEADTEAQLGHTIDPAGYPLLLQLYEKLKKTKSVSKSLGPIHLDSLFRTFMYELFDKQPRDEEFLQECAAFLQRIKDYKAVYSTYVPVTGIKVVGTALEIGKVRFVSVDDEVVRAVQTRLDAVKDVNDQVSQEARAVFSREGLKSRLGHTVAKLTVDLSPDLVDIMAKHDTLNALAALQFLVRNKLPPQDLLRCHFDLRGGSETPSSVVLQVNEEGNDFSIFERSTKPTTDVPFSEESYEALQRLGLTWINQLLTNQESELTPVQRSLFLALHWYYRGWNADSEVDALLSYVFVIESLLKIPTDYQILKYLSETLSLLMESRVELRMELYEDLRKMYKARSSVVHSGLLSVPPGVLATAESAAHFLIEFIGFNSGKLKEPKDIEEFFLKLRITPELSLLHRGGYGQKGV